MQVPLFDSTQEDRALDIQTVMDVFRSGRFVDGKERIGFEKELAEFFSSPAVAVNSGTDALEAAIRAHNPSPRATVAVPANTFRGTVSAIRAAGCIPVYVDVDRNGLMTTPADTEGCIVVDLCGHKAPRKSFGRQWTIVDACQSLFGGDGLTSCYSFHPTKPLGGYGTGGAVVGSEEVCSSVELWRWHGPGGRNSRLPEAQAHILRKKLPLARDKIARRRWIAEQYKVLPLRATHPQHSHWHTYPVYAENNEHRDYLFTQLAKRKVQTKLAYPPLTDKCPNALAWSQQILYLPIWAGMSDDQVAHVLDSVKDIL